MRCTDCDRELADAFAVRDWAEELGPFCCSCALETMANVQGADDAAALRFERWHSPEREWVDRGGRRYERQDNPPSWVKDEPTWEAAKAAVRPRWDDYADPWAVVVQVYKAMGGR